jgi:N-acetylmuramoyl-L-alanine amidase
MAIPAHNDVMRIMGPGASGDDVRDVQSRLGSLGYHIDPDEHGQFGESTAQAVREFQGRRELLVDGLVGEDTWLELVEAGHTLGDRVLYFRLPSSRGDDVRALQGWLNLLGFDAGREDGIFGERTDRAVREFQRNVGLAADGIVGSTTLAALTRLRPVRESPGRAVVREAEALRRLTATLQGARIGIDAGHGPEDPGETGPGGLVEADACAALAAAFHEELKARGAEPFFVRTPEETPPAHERARRANEFGAELLVSLHLSADPDPGRGGAASYYYGRGSYGSQAGRRLAELIQEELTELGLTGEHAQPKSLPLLRETRMPAVHVQPCHITNPADEARLGDEAFQRAVAVALGTALQRFFDGAASGGTGQDPERQPKHEAKTQGPERP